MNEMADKTPHRIPQKLEALENTTHLFQIHFGSGSKKTKPKFVAPQPQDSSPTAETDIEKVRPSVRRELFGSTEKDAPEPTTKKQKTEFK